MKEIYWIQRLDNIYEAFIAFLVLAMTAIVALSIAYSLAKEYESHNAVSLKRWLICSIVSAVVSANGLVFMPTTKEAFTIIGVGGTIEYLQENNTLKDLPDKCVKALEIWVDSMIEED